MQHCKKRGKGFVKRIRRGSSFKASSFVRQQWSRQLPQQSQQYLAQHFHDARHTCDLGITTTVCNLQPFSSLQVLEDERLSCGANRDLCEISVLGCQICVRSGVPTVHRPSRRVPLINIIFHEDMTHVKETLKSISKGNIPHEKPRGMVYTFWTKVTGSSIVLPDRNQ
jgi:hypothetical protein